MADLGQKQDKKVAPGQNQEEMVAPGQNQDEASSSFLEQTMASFAETYTNLASGPKPSFSEAVSSVDDFIAKYKVVSTIGHITSFMEAKTAKRKLAYLVCILENYQDAGIMASAEQFIKFCPYLEEFFAMILRFAENPTEVATQSIELAQQAKFQDFIDTDNNLLFNPTATIDEQPTNVHPILQAMDEHMSMLRPLLGLVSVFACAMGFSELMKMTWLSQISKEVCNLGNLFKAKKVIAQEVNSGVDSILTLVYSGFGGVYYTERTKRLNAIVKRVEKVREILRTYLDGTKTDAFGLLRLESISSISTVIDQLQMEINTFSAEDMNIYNFRDAILEARCMLTNLRERRIALIKGGSKQVPVRLWLYGSAGVGKSYLAASIAHRLCGQKSVYTRNSNDNHWNTYSGQSCVIFDDILQNQMSDDANEWMKFSTEAAQDVPMAELNDKGMPFTSRYMIATSNMAYMREHRAITDMDAFNRRRDILVHAVNPHLIQYKRENHGQDPPRDWYQSHPTQLRIYNALRPQVLPPDFMPAHTGLVGVVTEDELCIIMAEMEKANAEHYRQSLVSRQLGQYVTIPPKIEYDSRKIEFAKIFDPVLKKPRYDLNNPGADIVRVPLDDEVSVSTVASGDTGIQLAEQALNIQPVSVESNMEMYPLIIFGEPGMGKTYLIDQVLNGLQREDSSLVVNRLTLEDIAKPDWLSYVNKTGGIVFFDDFTINDKTMEVMATLAHQAYAGRLRVRGLIATGNTKTGLWTGERKRLIERRSDCLHLSLKVAALAKWTFSRQPLDKFLDSVGRDRNIVTRIGPQKQEWEYGHLGQFIRNAFKTSSRDVITYSPFILPMHQSWDVYVKIDLSGLNPNPKALEVFHAVRTMEAVRRTTDGVVKLSAAEVCAATYRLAPIFQTQAFGSVMDIVTKFNEEKHPVLLDYHVLAEIKAPDGYPDFIIGFAPSEGQTLAYAVDTATREEITLVGEDVFIDGVIQTKTTPNLPYFNLVSRVFQQLPPKEFKVPSEQDILIRLLRTTPWGETLIALVSTASVSIKVLAMAALLGNIDERSVADEEEEEEEVYQERRKRDKVINVHRDTTGHSVNRRSQNQVQTEAERPSHTPIANERRRRDARVPAVHRQPSKNSVDRKPQNNVHTERRRRDAKVADPHRDPSAHEVQRRAQNNVSTEAYDVGDVRPKRAHVEVESGINQDGTLVQCNGQYGVLSSQCVYYADEVSRGHWRFMAYPLTEAWQVVPLDKLPKSVTYGKRTIDLTYKRQQVSSDMLRCSIGRTWIYSVDDPLDLGSVLACTFAFGMPIDIEAQTLVPEAIARCNEESEMDMRPLAYHNFAKRHFKPFAAPFTRVVKEGMKDPELCAAAHRLAGATCSLLDHGTHSVYGLFIGKNLVLSVGHAYANNNKLQVVRDGKQYDVELVTLNKRADLSIGRITDPTFPAAKNIAHMFVDKEALRVLMTTQLTRLPGLMVRPPTAENNAFTHAVCTIDALVHGANHAGFNGRQINYNAQLRGLTMTGVSLAGDCGSLVLLSNKQLTGRIVGMHRAGSDSISVGSLITREWVEDMLKQPEALLADNIDKTSQKLRTEGISIVPIDQALQPIRYDNIELHEVRKCNTTGLGWVADLPKPVYTPTTTRIKRTGLTVPEGCDIHEPSIMSEKDPRCDGWKPYEEGLRRYGERQVTSIPDRAAVQNAFAEIGNEMVQRIRAQKQYVRVITKTEAINTPPFAEHPNAHPIDRSGSAGFPHMMTGHGTSKSDYLFFNEKHKQWYFKQEPAAQQISTEAEAIVQDARYGRQRSHPFVAYLKDEPLTKKKIYDQKRTRLFFSGSFQYLIAYRRYYLSAMLRIMELYNDIPVKVGISATMKDWNSLAYQLRKVSNQGFASDVSRFDSSVPLVFLEEVTEVFNAIYTHCSLPGEKIDEGNRVREVLHRAIEGALVIGKKAVFKLDQAQVSGNPATALENSFIMWALYYLVWKQLALEHEPTMATYRCFRDNVALAIYGDDNICTVSPQCPWFNFNTFAAAARNFGFAITDAKKRGGDVPDFQPLEEMDFLKRSFRQEQNLWCGPLDIQSIGKSMSWIRDSAYTIKAEHIPLLGGSWPTSDNIDLISASIDAMWPEVALHGRETYEAWVNHLVPQFGDLGINNIPPRWEQAMAKYDYTVY